MKDYINNKILYKLFFLIFSIFMFIAMLMTFGVQYISVYRNIFLFCLLSNLLLIFIMYKLINIIDLNKSNEKTLLFLIIILGVLIRIVVIGVIKTEPISDFLTPHNFYNHYKQIDEYQFSQNLDSYQLYYSRYPAWFPYMCIISLLYNIFGFNPEIIKIFNVILNIFTMLVLYKGARNLFSKKIGLIAIIIFGCSPSLALYAGISTPDHISMLIMSCIIFFWSKMILYRNTDRKKQYIHMLITIFCGVLLNLFKPLSIYMILVFLCVELAMLNKDKWDYKKFKILFKQYITYALFFLILNLTTNSILNITIKNFFKTEVVDSTPIFMYGGYAVDDFGNYNPTQGSSLVVDILNKYGSDQQAAMAELSVLAKKQFFNNIHYLPKILMQKYQLATYSEYSYWGFANTSSKEGYKESVSMVIQTPYLSNAASYMLIIYSLSFITGAYQLICKRKDTGVILLGVMIFGYLLILILGGVQGRYKSLVMPQFALIAAIGVEKSDILFKQLQKFIIKVRKKDYNDEL